MRTSTEVGRKASALRRWSGMEHWNPINSWLLLRKIQSQAEGPMTPLKFFTVNPFVPWQSPHAQD